MFYQHWKKFALALTGFFWASCENSTSADSSEQEPESSSSEKTLGSSSAVNSSSSSQTNDNGSDLQKPSSSSEALNIAMPLYGVRDTVIQNIESSASVGASSSSEGGFEIIAPAYGVFDKVACYDALADKQTLVREQDNGITILTCDDGVNCQEKITENWVSEYECIEDICPDYGVVKISEKKYACDDGNLYNEAQFQARYYKKSGTKPDDGSDSQFDGPIAVYGPPCYFDGTCRNDSDK